MGRARSRTHLERRSSGSEIGSFYPGPAVVDPGRDRLLIALGAWRAGFCRLPAQLPQQSQDVARVMAHRGLSFNHVCRPLEGPLIGGVAGGQRPVQQPALHRCRSLRTEPERPARPLRSPQRRWCASSSPPLHHTSARRLAGHSQGLGHCGRRLTTGEHSGHSHPELAQRHEVAGRTSGALARRPRGRVATVWAESSPGHLRILANHRQQFRLFSDLF